MLTHTFLTHDPSRLTPEQQTEWKKKLTNYAYEVSIACDALNAMQKVIQGKVSGTVFKVMDASIRAVYAGLLKVYDMLNDAMSQVKKGLMPDFTGEIDFPPQPPPLPSDPSKIPSWFQIAWKTIEDSLNLLAQKNPKLAEYLPPIEAAGNELVKDLEKYFPSVEDESEFFPVRPQVLL